MKIMEKSKKFIDPIHTGEIDQGNLALRPTDSSTTHSLTEETL